MEAYQILSFSKEKPKKSYLESPVTAGAWQEPQHAFLGALAHEAIAKRAAAVAIVAIFLIIILICNLSYGIKMS